MAAGSILYSVGIIILLLSLLLLLTELKPFLPIRTTTPQIDSTIAGAIVGSLLLILLGGIIVLIGAIFLAIGLYRSGEMFDNIMVRVGGLLHIIINVVGALLMIIGITHVLDRIRRTASSGAEENLQK